MKKELKRIALHTNAEAVAIEVNPLVISIGRKWNVTERLGKYYRIESLCKGNEFYTNHIKVKAYGSMERARKMSLAIEEKPQHSLEVVSQMFDFSRFKNNQKNQESLTFHIKYDIIGVCGSAQIGF